MPIVITPVDSVRWAWAVPRPGWGSRLVEIDRWPVKWASSARTRSSAPGRVVVAEPGVEHRRPDVSGSFGSATPTSRISRPSTGMWSGTPRPGRACPARGGAAHDVGLGHVEQQEHVDLRAARPARRPPAPTPPCDPPARPRRRGRSAGRRRPARRRPRGRSGRPSRCTTVSRPRSTGPAPGCRRSPRGHRRRAGRGTGAVRPPRRRRRPAGRRASSPTGDRRVGDADRDRDPVLVERDAARRGPPPAGTGPRRSRPPRPRRRAAASRWRCP